MSGFSEPLEVEWVQSGRLALTAPLYYESRSREVFEVPEGFQTDLASVPALARAFTPSKIEGARAAVLHDRLYFTGEVSRKRADDLFREGLRCVGIGRFHAWIMWAGVRSGGWVAWRKHRKAG